MDAARIEQFRKMASDDPDNELGHFSLGKAYMEAGRHAEAIPCFERAIDLNPRNSRTYHLLAMAQREAGDISEALSTLRIGFEVARSRGDVKPRQDMAALMRELGESPPEMDESTVAPASPRAGEGQVVCRRCGQSRPPLQERPFKGPLGEQVLSSVCAACWQEWVRMGTKVINELRLDFARPEHAAVYDQHMKEFLELD